MRLQIKKYFAIILTLLSTCFFLNSFAATNDIPLPTAQAFPFSVHFTHAKKLAVEWQIMPGYFLYAKRVSIKAPSDAKAIVHYPQGEFKYDESHGKYEIFTGNISIPVDLETNNETVPVPLTVNYQGCSQGGFCYPPMQETVLLNMKTQMVSINTTMTNTTTPSLLTSQTGVAALFLRSQVSMLVIFIGLGLLLAFTPCVLPMIPILTGIIVGQKKVTTKKAFFLSTTYVLGMALAYAAAGVLVAYAGSSLQVALQKPWIIALTSGLFIALSLSLFGFYELRLPNRLHQTIYQWSAQQQGGTYAGVFCMGVLSTLVVSPCVTAPLVGVLMYIGQTGDLILGASALFALAIGMGLPLILIGTSAGKWLPKSGPWMDVVKKFFGLLLLAVAVILLMRIMPHTGSALPSRTAHTMNAPSFVVINDMKSLNEQLSAAKAENKPVLLDFYADWCDACVVMERKVFELGNVKQALQDYVLLRADLSNNTSDDEALMKQFNVIAPPTVLFFGADGLELHEKRIVGEVDANEFLHRLGKVASCTKTATC